MSSVAMAGVSLYSGYAQSEAEKGLGRLEESRNRFNARMAEYAAEDAIRRGDREAGKVRQMGKRVRGAQRAGFAGQGVDVNVGTPVELQEETSLLAEEDMRAVKNNAWREAFGYKVQAADYRMAASYARYASRTRARTTMLTGVMNAGSFIIQGARQAAAAGAGG